MKSVILDELYKFLRISRIRSITSLFQAMSPSFVIGGFQVKEELIPVPVSEEIGVITE